MSRIGKLPIAILDGVTVEIKDNVVTVKGPKATLTQEYAKNVTVEVKDNHIYVTRNDETTESNMNQGLYRQLIHNMVTGVKDGFKKTLTVKGVGYKLNKQGENKLVMSLGLSHPVEFVADEGITFDVPDNNTIVVKGADKQLVGAVAAKIKALRPVEPYHGYGIRYADEVVILKAGKAAGKKKK